MSVTAPTIIKLIDELNTRSKLLPMSIPAGKKDDKLYSVVSHAKGSTDVWEGLNKCFDAAFGSDCCDAEGRLTEIRRGRLGMTIFIGYLNEIQWKPSIPLDIVLVRLQRILDAVNDLIQNPPTKENANAKSKTQPAPKPTTKKANISMNGPLLEDEADDRSYHPRGHHAASQEPEEEFELDADGLELIDVDEITEHCRKRKLVFNAGTDESDDGYATETGKDGSSLMEQVSNRTKNKVSKSKSSKAKALRKPPAKKQKKSAPPPKVTVVDADSSDDDEQLGKGPSGGRGPTNKSRKHFYLPKATRNSKTGDRWEFGCRHCKKTITFPRKVDRTKSFEDEVKQPALGNLATHMHTEHPDLLGTDPDEAETGPSVLRGVSAASAKIMEEFLREGKLNPSVDPTQKGFIRVFAAWIIEDDHAWSTGEEPGLKRLFEYMQSHFLLPSDTTVRNTLYKIYAEMYETVKAELRAVKSKIVLSSDTWTNRSMRFTFAGSIAGWIDDDWNLVERVIDFHPIADKEHEGEYAAIGLAKVLQSLGILDKILSLSLDNAATNTVLVATLTKLLKEKLEIPFNAENSQIRCLAHVVNLIVQKILAYIQEADDPDIVDYFKENGELPVHVDEDEDEEAIAFEEEGAAERRGNTIEDDSDDDDETRGGGELNELNTDEVMADIRASAQNLSALKKLRTIVTKIVSSPQWRRKFRRAAARKYKDSVDKKTTKKLAHLMVIRDVRTRWNSTYAMIQHALKLRLAIDEWVFGEERELLLAPDQWDMLSKLGDLLKVFSDVTLQISYAGVPTLPWVLPMYVHMEEHLTTWFQDSQQPVVLQLAASAGLEKLQKYHSIAKSSQFNIIATMLHPHLGKPWFQKVGSHYADRAETLFSFVFQKYKENTASTTATTQTQAPAETSTTFSFLSKVLKKDCQVPALDTAHPPVMDPSSTELQRFLGVASTKDYDLGDENAPHRWWKENEKFFPTVACMARDFLAIPATSVSVERLFSKSRQICTDVRSSLKAETIMVAMLTKMWIRAGFFVA